MSIPTLFLRLEGPLQSWGDQQSKFVVRRTARAPTKSGIIGMLCSALAISRSEALYKLPTFSRLKMGVRIDRPGIRIWDYHTVGANMRKTTAEGKSKTDAILSRREYLSDASFLVALQADQTLISELEEALKNPKWSLYLGRKSCPPSRPVAEHPSGKFPDLISALQSVPWLKRSNNDSQPTTLTCFLDWEPTTEESSAPDDALVWYDVPLSLDPPSHRPRFVIKRELPLGIPNGIQIEKKPAPLYTSLRPRADYTNSEYKKRREERLKHDKHLCVFCKSPANTVQHVTYRHAGGEERIEELRSLCRLCHDAVTMIEYGLNMGLDRINPEEERWREQIIRKRKEIIRFRSLETRRRRLQPEEV